MVDNIESSVMCLCHQSYLLCHRLSSEHVYSSRFTFRYSLSISAVVLSSPFSSEPVTESLVSIVCTKCKVRKRSQYFPVVRGFV